MSQVVDFTIPYYHESLGVLVRKQLDLEGNLIVKVFQPFHASVWATVIGAMLLVAVVLWLSQTVTNNEKERKYLLSWLWFAFGNLLAQGLTVFALSSYRFLTKLFLLNVITAFW